jgi:hypothetical protein
VRKYRLDVFAALWVPCVLLVVRFWFVTDDAFISFRYARNLALGRGPRFNPGEHLPVEGYSNFLWVLICGVFEWLRMEITLWPPLVSAACGTALLWLVFDTLRRRLGITTPVAALATLTLGCFPPFAVWSSSGLETMPFALLVFIVFERLVLRREAPDGVGAGIAGLLLALIRLEGIAWVAVILIITLLSRRSARERWLRPLAICALTVGVGYAAYFVWRYTYYEVPLPNTAYVKADLSAERLMRGVDYVVTFALVFLSPILIVPGSLFALRRDRIARGPEMIAMAWSFPLYSVLVTGDFMAMGRFLIPGLPFATILLAWMLADLWGAARWRRAAAVVAALAVVVLGLLPGWNRHLVPEATRARFRFRHMTDRFKSELEQWQRQRANVDDWSREGRALRHYVQLRALPDANPSYVAGAIGARAYYSDLFLLDQHGLVTAEVARREVRPDEALRSPGHDKRVPMEYFLKDKPTILSASVVQSADPRVVAAACARQARALRLQQMHSPPLRRYVVDFAPVPAAERAAPHVLVTWRRLADGVDPTDAWAAFERRLSALRARQTIEPPDSVPQPPRPG